MVGPRYRKISTYEELRYGCNARRHLAAAKRASDNQKLSRRCANTATSRPQSGS